MSIVYVEQLNYDCGYYPQEGLCDRNGNCDSCPNVSDKAGSEKWSRQILEEISQEFNTIHIIIDGPEAIVTLPKATPVAAAKLMYALEGAAYNGFTGDPVIKMAGDALVIEVCAD